MFWGASHLEAVIVPLYVQKVLNPLRNLPTDEAVVATAMKDLPRFLPVLEQQLGRGPWVLGEHFSLVDVALGTTCDSLEQPAVGIDLASAPNIRAWHARLAARPSWKAGVAAQ
jgi:glutathione S-transferase